MYNFDIVPEHRRSRQVIRSASMDIYHIMYNVKRSPDVGCVLYFSQDNSGRCLVSCQLRVSIPRRLISQVLLQQQVSRLNWLTVVTCMFNSLSAWVAEVVVKLLEKVQSSSSCCPGAIGYFASGHGARYDLCFTLGMHINLQCCARCPGK